MATYNVMTLRTHASESTEDNFAGIGAAHLLGQQLHHSGYHIIGLQETRASQQCTFSTENYLRFVGGSKDSKGHRGVELWLSRRLSYTCTPDSNHFFREQDLAILSAEDDLLYLLQLSIAQATFWSSLFAMHPMMALRDSEKTFG